MGESIRIGCAVKVLKHGFPKQATRLSGGVPGPPASHASRRGPGTVADLVRLPISVSKGS